MQSFDKRLQAWRELQELELDSYRESYKNRGDYYGYFSTEERSDAKVAGKYIAECCGSCLDVGSGILPRPVYMNSSVRFVGLDPFFGEYHREFPFAQAIGERLPFPDKSFECVSFMSTLDHQIEPLTSLKEAFRVAMNDGSIFIWGNFFAQGSRSYRLWKSQPKGSKISSHHQHAFTITDVKNLLETAGFSYKKYQYIKRGRLRTHLIMGRK